VIRKIAILGPESTGKSWLAEQLASHYQSSWVPEFARTYLNSIQRNYTIQDIEFIAQNQFHKNLLESEKSTDIYFADTEMIVCYIWASYVSEVVPESISKLCLLQNFDLYLLCDIDLPWEPDPLREHPHKRKELFDRYVAELETRNLPYTVISGFGDIRLEHAVSSIETWFKNTSND
jgi:nicotinamide riboside kinase